VADRIRLFPRALDATNATEVLAMIHTPKIAAFMHDADGRIDRDFELFWPRLVENGLIVIDDYEPIIKPARASDGDTRYVGKKLMTYLLLNSFIEWGLMRPAFYRHNTVFGYKPERADFSRFDRTECERIVELVHQISSGDFRG